MELSIYSYLFKGIDDVFNFVLLRVFIQLILPYHILDLIQSCLIKL